VAVDDVCDRARQAGLDLWHRGRASYPDFVHVEVPCGPAGDGALRPAALLAVSLAAAGVGASALPVLARLVGELGECRTIWAVRCRDGRLSWELYLYQRPGLGPVGVGRLAEVLAPEVTVEVPPVPAGLPADVVSIDLDEASFAGTPVTALHLYLPNRAARRRGGLSYRLDTEGLAMENCYAVFELPAEEPELWAAVAECAHLRALGRLDPPPVPDDLSSASLAHLARKPTADGLYLSRLPVPAALGVATRTGFPPAFTDAVAAAVARLEHLRIDVGVDVRVEPSGPVVSASTLFVAL
jgi:hypothetical protein